MAVLNQISRANILFNHINTEPMRSRRQKMKYAIISDIHGNMPELQAVIEYLKL